MPATLKVTDIKPSITKDAGGDRHHQPDESRRYEMRRESERRFLIPFSSPSARVTMNSRSSKSSRVPASASATMSSAKSPRHAANVTDATLPTRKKMDFLDLRIELMQQRYPIFAF